MNNTLIDSVCIRCGKVRVIKKSSKSYIGGSLVTVTMTICPDSTCQKLVDEILKKEQVKRQEIALKIEERQSSWKKNAVKGRRHLT